MLESVPDPEIPVVSVVDLGIVREVRADRVTITPTYTGCPATQVIERDIRDALDAAGYRDVADRDDAVAALDDRLDQRERQGEAARLRHRPAERRRETRDLPAMRLDATRKRSAASARRPCKAQWRCRDCLEPFDRFKCH